MSIKEFSPNLTTDKSVSIPYKIFGLSDTYALVSVKDFFSKLLLDALTIAVTTSRVFVSGSVKEFQIYHSYVKREQITSTISQLKTGNSLTSDFSLFLDTEFQYWTNAQKTTAVLKANGTGTKIVLNKLDALNTVSCFAFVDKSTKKIRLSDWSDNVTLEVFASTFAECCDSEGDSDVEIKNLKTDIASIKAIDTTQTSLLNDISSQLSAVKTINSTQDTRISRVESVNTTQGISISTIRSSLDTLRSDFNSYKTSDKQGLDQLRSDLTTSTTSIRADYKKDLDDAWDKTKTLVLSSTDPVKGDVSIIKDDIIPDHERRIHNAEEGIVLLKASDMQNEAFHRALESKIDLQKQSADKGIADANTLIDANYTEVNHRLDVHEQALGEINAKHAEIESTIAGLDTSILQRAGTYSEEKAHLAEQRAKDYANVTFATTGYVDNIKVHRPEDLLRVDNSNPALPKLVTSLDLGGLAIINVAHPVVNSDAATKQYVDIRVVDKADVSYVDMKSDTVFQNFADSFVEKGAFESFKKSLREELNGINDKALKGVKRLFSSLVEWDETKTEGDLANEFIYDGTKSWKKVKTNMDADTVTASSELQMGVLTTLIKGYAGFQDKPETYLVNAVQKSYPIIPAGFPKPTPNQLFN